MEKYYSKILPLTLLHIVNRGIDSMGKERIDISPENEFLQLAILNMNKGKTFKPHKHQPCNKQVTITQECWIIIKGAVRAILYDMDDSIIASPILRAGDSSITFYGGHTYEILEEGTVVYEIKNGPYRGQQHDKIFI